jgi:Ca2+-binding EF-hand superfamily protein
VTSFQQGIVAFIMTFKQRYDELDRLRMIFLSVDKSNDGMLTIEEVREGLVTVMGRVKGNLQEF